MGTRGTILAPWDAGGTGQVQRPWCPFEVDAADEEFVQGKWLSRFQNRLTMTKIILAGYPINRLIVKSHLTYLKFLSLQSQTQGLACSVIDLRLVSGTKTSSRSVRRSLWSTLTDSTLFSFEEAGNSISEVENHSDC